MKPFLAHSKHNVGFFRPCAVISPSAVGTFRSGDVYAANTKLHVADQPRKPLVGHSDHWKWLRNSECRIFFHVEIPYCRRYRNRRCHYASTKVAKFASASLPYYKSHYLNNKTFSIVIAIIIAILATNSHTKSDSTMEIIISVIRISELQKMCEASDSRDTRESEPRRHVAHLQTGMEDGIKEISGTRDKRNVNI